MRASYGNVHNVYVDIGIGGIPISVSTLLGIFLGFLDLLLFHYLLALDHAPAAVLAFFLALFTGSTAARTVVIVSDLGADDLLLSALSGSESQTADEPFDELIYQDKRRHHYDKGDESSDSFKDPEVIVIVPVVAPVASFLVLFRKSEGIIGIYDLYSVLIRIRRLEGKISVVAVAVRLPCSGPVCVPEDSQIVHVYVIKPGRRKGVYGLSCHVLVDLIHVVLSHGEFQAYYLVLSVGTVKIDLKMITFIIDVIYGVRSRLDIFVMVIGHAQIDPFQLSVLVFVQNFPVNMVSHIKSSVIIYVYLDDKVKDLIR